jgi:signal transduction histidine kinase
LVHAQSQVIRVSLRRDGGQARLLVVDDGRGFAVPVQLRRLAAAGHLGLLGAQERVHRVGGSLTVTSAPGAGTVVQVTLPLPPPSGSS